LPSFGSEIRRQLASGTSSGPRRGDRAELAGLLDAAGKWDGSGVFLDTPSAAVARSAVRLWRHEFGVVSKLSPAGTDRFGRARYSVRTGGIRVFQAAEEMRIVRLSRDAAVRTAYLSGAFQGCGSIVRPGGRGGHHFEFVHKDEAFIRRVAEFSRAKLTVAKRRNRWLAYTKSSDGVTTILAQLGLHDAILEYEAKAILGEAKANANRVTNFDSANAGRTAKAASRQQRILETLDPEKLPEALRDMLSLRLDNPAASLAELADLGGISKSAANHRLRRLVERGAEKSK
jgi:DNA-binding transcriptional regulator WhiA